MASKIEILLLGNARQLRKELGSAGRSADSTFKRIQRGARVAGLAIAGGLGIAAKVGFDELMEGQKVSAQTSAALTSTGHAANVTKGHIQELAGAILKKSGIDDEAIQSGENLLLTFTNIRDEAGKGNKIFDQATQVSADLSRAFGKDMTSSARLVGKALNDPVKGLTALTRVGIQFTDGQKKTIERLVESGHTVKAQQLILAQLNKRVGGSAEAYGKTLPGQIDIAKETFRNLAAELVKALLPAFTMVAGAILRVTGYLTEHQTVAKILVAALAGLAAVLLAVSVGTSIYNAATKVAKAATAAWTAAQWLMNAALTANPIGLVILAIVALAAVIVIAWKRSSTFRAIVTGAFDAVKGAALALAGAFASAFHAIASVASSVAHVVTSTWDRVVGFFHNVKSRLAGAFSGMFDGIKGAFRGSINYIINAWNGLSFSLPSVDTHIPGVGTVGGWSINTPDIPNVATGGIVRARPGGTILRAGEARRREAIIPLPRGFDLSRMGPVEVNVSLSREAIAGIARVEVKRGNERVTKVIEAGAVWS